MNLRKLEKAVNAIITKHAPDPDSWYVGMDEWDDGEPVEPDYCDAWRQDKTHQYENGSHRYNFALTFYRPRPVEHYETGPCAHLEYRYRLEAEPEGLFETPLVKRSVSWKEGIALLKKEVGRP